MATIKSVIRKDKVNSKGECLVVVLYTHKSKSVKFSSGVKVDPKFWVGDKNQRYPISKAFRGYESKSNLINQEVQKIEEIVVSLKREKNEPETRVVKEEYEKIYNEKESIENREGKKLEFFSVFEEFIEKIKAEQILSSGTIKHYVTTRNHLLDYSTEKKIVLNFEGFDKVFYSKYMQHLKEPIKYNKDKKRIGGGKGLSDSTRGTQIKNLKAFLGNCFEDNIPVNPYFRKFKVLKEVKPIIYLTQFEFEKFRSFDFSDNPRLERVRDLFLIACRTGLRVSDLSRLSQQHFVDNRIMIRAHKNRKDLSIKITPLVDAVLGRYNYNLPKISDQKYNKYIKEAGKIAGIDQPVELVTGSNKKYKIIPKHELMSSHTAVKTFITHCGEKGISAKVVAEITGKTVQVILDHYYGTNEETVDREMEKAFGNDQPLMKAI